jgi:alkylhydroperoxidase/carboxymuconolactone decarboxylase family protein YurZ
MRPKEETMGGHLPPVFGRFGSDYPAVMEAFRGLAERLHEAGPLSARERRLAKLGIAIGRESEGGVRSHARKALAEGIEPEAIRHVALLAISTGGYPAAMAALSWINEVLDREDRHPSARGSAGRDNGPREGALPPG